MIRLAVFGQPVSQSLSPQIHRLFARQFGLPVEYRAIEATPDSFPDSLRRLMASGGRGCNVTVPLKRAAWTLATESSDRARRAEAANTLVFGSAETILADNTDGQGLVDDLRSGSHQPIRGRRVCMLGAGGAAAGVLAALLESEPARLVLANRTLETARALATRHADLGSLETCRPADLESLGPFDLVVNATSAGHAGQAPEFSPGCFAQDALCYDMNYGRAAEPLRALCSDLGVRFSDGLGMLVRQAALSFELWTGCKPDAASVLSAVRSGVRHAPAG